MHVDVSEPNDSSYLFFLSVIELDNGNLATICTGTHKVGYNLKGLCVFFMLDSEGDSLWTRNIYHPTYANENYGGFLKVLHRTPDNGFVFAGYLEHDTMNISQQAWLVKTDSLGYDGTFIREYKQESVEVQVYPNPTMGMFKLNISNAAVSLSNYTYNVHNIVGELIISESVTTKEIQRIDITRQPSGIYILSVVKEGRVVFGTKVVKW